MTQSTVVIAVVVLVAIVTQQQSQHHVVGVYGFSMSMSLSMSSIMTSDSNNNFDRFKSVCLTDKKKRESVIKEFGDESLLSSLGLHSQNVDDDNDNENDNDELWAAVYRSNNNKPSVIVRDDFFRAMNDATTKSSTTTKSSVDDNDDAMNNVSIISPSNTATFLSDTMPDLLQIPSSKPVAIARLIKTKNKDSYLLDNLRCSLKKEDQDINCDGGSEYLEALACAVDTLLLNHLQKLVSSSSSSTNTPQENDDVPIIFKDGSIRTKATLFNSKLFEQRGFIPIETLSRDMATHVSNYNSCSNSYTERASSGEQSTTTTTATNSGIGFGQKQKQSDKGDDDAASSNNSNNDNDNDNTTTTTTMMATGTRDRALQIVSLLGRLDPKNIVSDESDTNKTDDDDKDDEEDEYDPWATMYVKR